MEFFDIDPKLRALGEQAEHKAREQFAQIDRAAQYNSEKVLSAFIKNGVSESHFTPSTGYGYGDRGREVMDAVLADIFGCEDALIRYNFMSGTHALTVALFGVLRPGDKMVSLTGMPYDTLHGVIGIGEKEGVSGSLKDFGIRYEQLDLTADGTVNYDAIPEAVKGAKVAYIQRSRGYSLRPSLFVEDIERIVQKVRQSNPEAIVMVDNCYGEFVREKEPSHYGADVCVGSLIKNPGGGLAPTGGYIVGKRDAVERIAYRLTAPGIGLEVGSYAGSYQPFYQGLFMAPHTVCQAIKTACLAAAVFESLGMTTTPPALEERADIIQAIQMKTPERLVAFCQGIQMASPIDSMALPEPWAMPGYQDQVVMAAGTFVSGASIELSADAPMREPYTAYMQGGLTYIHGRVALAKALERMVSQGCLEI